MITMTAPAVSRRSFLASAAAAGGGLSLGFSIPFGLTATQAADTAPEVNAWVIVRLDDPAADVRALFLFVTDIALPDFPPAARDQRRRVLI